MCDTIRRTEGYLCVVCAITDQVDAVMESTPMSTPVLSELGEFGVSVNISKSCCVHGEGCGCRYLLVASSVQVGGYPSRFAFHSGGHRHVMVKSTRASRNPAHATQLVEHTGRPGRPCVVVQESQLIGLRQLSFLWSEISTILGVSRRTLYDSSGVGTTGAPGAGAPVKTSAA